jgi:hypothetical protein
MTCACARAVADLIGSDSPKRDRVIVVTSKDRPSMPVNGDGRDPPGQSVLAGGPLGEALRMTGHDNPRLPMR